MRRGNINQQFKSILLFLLFLFSFAGFTLQAADIKLEFNRGLATPDTRGGMVMDDKYLWISDHKNGLWRVDRCTGASAGDTTSDDSASWDLWWYNDGATHNGYPSDPDGTNGTDGYYIYEVSADQKVYVIDTSSPANIANTANIDVGDNAWGIYATDSTTQKLFVAADNGLHIYDISNPIAPDLNATILGAFKSVRGEAGHGYVYATRSDTDDVVIIDISTNAVVSTLDPDIGRGAGDPTADDLRRPWFYINEAGDPYLYAVNDKGDLWIIDVSTPAAPTVVSRWAATHNDSSAANDPAGAVYVRNDFAYIGTSEGNTDAYLYLLDVSDPVNPELIDTVYDAGSAFNEVRGDGCEIHIAAHNGWKMYTMTGWQPDMQISNTDGSNYIGEGIYQKVPEANQTKEQTIVPNETVVFEYNVTNTASHSDEFILKGTAEKTGWVVKYFDSDNVDITTEITTNTYTKEMDANESFTLSMEVKLASEAACGVPYDLTLLTDSNMCPDGNCSGTPDAVLARVTRACIEAIDDSSSGGADEPQLIAILDNDSSNSDPSTVTTSGFLQPTDGSVVINADGTVTYTPNNGYIGIDTFEYQVCKINDTTLCDIALVTVNISCIFTPGENHIRGTVFNDQDLNASFDNGEPVVDGVTVNLYEDMDNNGVPDDTAIQSTVTDASGMYDFGLSLTYETVGTPYQQRTLSEDDDAREKANGDVQTDQDLKITKTDDNKWNGLRFTNITIPDGAVITNVFIRFTSQNDKSGTNALVKFYGEDDTSNAAAFVNGSNGTLTGRTRTSSTVSWDVPAWTTDNTYDSPDLTNIVQEIIDDQGGLSAGSMVFITEGIGSNEERKAYDYGADPGKSPELFIEFTIPGDDPYYYLTEIVPPVGTELTTGTYQATYSDFAADGVGSCGNDHGLRFPPNLTVTIDCQPKELDIGETTICTVTYSNADNAGPADYIEYHINYPEDRGPVGNFVLNESGDSAEDITAADDYINWVIGGTDPTALNIAAGQSGSMTFEFTMETGGGDFTMPVGTFENNGTEDPVDQGINAEDEIITLPVTLAYVYAKKSGERLEVDFSTSSEIGNIGFNIYAVNGKKWTKLNDELIPGSLDSLEPIAYHKDLDIPSGLKVKEIGITGVDGDGTEDRHGPFKLNRKNGAIATVVSVDWKKVRKEVAKDKKARKDAKKSIKKTLKDQVIHLGVSEDAVYRVTHEELLTAEIDLEGQIAKDISITLREKGIARYIDGLDRKGKWTQESWIEFMGTAPKGSDALYLTNNLYQLGLEKKLVVESEDIEPLAVRTVIIETNNKYSYSLPQEDPFYDGYFYATGKGKSGYLARNFSLSEMPEGETSTLTLYLSAYSRTDHQLTIALNGTEIATKSAKGRMAWTIEIEVDNSLFSEDSNEIALTIPNRGGIFDYLVYDKMTLAYSTETARESLEPSIKLADKIGQKDLKPKKGTKYVIISHPLFMGEMGEALDRYIQQRESDGWKIKLVNVEEIYEAYGYGIATPESIKSYLKDARQQGVTHVQLVGAASYDYHDYLGTGAMSMIPSMYAVTNRTIQYTPCDGCLVADDTGMPQLAIGRWPVRMIAELDAVVSKTLAWDSMDQSGTHTALFIADKDDRSLDFGRQMDQSAQKFSDENWQDLTYVYLQDLIDEKGGNVDEAVEAARTQIAGSLAAGASIISYSGHSSPSQWSREGLLMQGDIVSIDNVDKTTLALPLACFTTYADSPYTNTMAYQLVSARVNGAVAVYGASMTSTYSANGTAAGKVIDGLLGNKTIGEAVLDAKQELGMKYLNVIRNGNLLGDVTLRLK